MFQWDSFCVRFHQRNKLLTQEFTTKHAEQLACKRSWGIVLVIKLGNCRPHSVILFLEYAIALEIYQLNLNVCRCFFSTSTANGLLNSSKLNVCASKLAKRRVNSARSVLSLSTKCAFGNAALETWFVIVWQNGEWHKFPCCIWISHSLAWKAFTDYLKNVRNQTTLDLIDFLCMYQK